MASTMPPASSSCTAPPDGVVDEAADEDEIFHVSLHYFGKFETVDGLLVYKGGHVSCRKRTL
uniref:Uncharacterized protein n=1 Tax=Aegilops tauschii TaxID=37682 RepID=M8CME7_AEGTA